MTVARAVSVRSITPLDGRLLIESRYGDQELLVFSSHKTPLPADNTGLHQLQNLLETALMIFTHRVRPERYYRTAAGTTSQFVRLIFSRSHRHRCIGPCHFQHNFS